MEKLAWMVYHRREEKHEGRDGGGGGEDAEHKLARIGTMLVSEECPGSWWW